MSLYSSIRLNLVIFSEINDSNSKNLAKELIKSLNLEKQVFEDILPIIDRSIKEDNFLLKQIRLTAITNGILNFTSATEYFIKDYIE